MYTAHFGLRERPFELTPDPRFCYESPLHREAWASLVYGVRERKGFVLLTGEVGTGKTTLLRRLMAELEPHVRCVFFYNTTLGFADLLTAACDELGLAVDAPGVLPRLRALGEWLIAELAEGRTAALLIDEAQHLADDVLENLRLLSNLETDRAKLVQIVLAGQPELDAKLERPGLRQLRQRIAVQCRLDRLRPGEVAAYIEHRLRTAGHAGRGLFTAEAVELIAACSSGLPRLVNALCDNALLAAYGAGHRRVGADIVREVARDLRLERPLAVAADGPASPRTAGRPAVSRLDAVRLSRRRGRWLRRSAAALVAALTVLGLVRTLTREQPGDPAVPVQPAGIAPGAEPTAPPGSGPAAAPPGPGGADAADALPAEATEEPPAAPELPARRRGQGPAPDGATRVVIGPGSSIGAIASERYGDRRTLGMDLIHEFNPAVRDVNRVLAGERLTLPALSRQTLVRREADGTARLIVASMPREDEARRLARTLERQGHRAIVTPRLVSAAFSLYRVEIAGLPDHAAVARVAAALDPPWAAGTAATTLTRSQP